MKFKEEVFSKIFTYVTVILLLGIVIFEAWSLQTERAALKRSEENAESISQNLDEMTGRNEKLQEENRELQIFQDTWFAYAAFVENSEVLSLKTDLFTRPDLIPQAAAEDALSKRKEAEEGEEEDGTEKDPEKDDENGEEGEERKPEFQFDNPDGEDIFFPLSIDSVKRRSCLVYTAAFEKTQGLSMELIYEIVFENGNAVVRDENGEIEWRCIAWNNGDGWRSVPETEGEDDDND